MNNQKTNLVHILLVEDNEGDILLTSEALEEYKVKTEISIAKNGQEALDFLFKRGEFMNKKTPDLILLDVNIPIFNGHEVLQKIKADSSLKKIPVIMLTTSSNQTDIAKAYKSNCNGYIKKPLEIEEFLSTILKIEQFCVELKILPN
jgi:CheY-like chemotaxis protein